MSFIDAVSQMGTQFKGAQYASTPAKNKVLYDALRAGDTSAREKLVTSNIRFVVKRVDDFLKRNPQLGYLGDDLVSGGVVGLTEAVNALTTKAEIKGLSTYLRRVIDIHIRRAVSEDDAVRMPRTIRFRKKKNETFDETELRRTILDDADFANLTSLQYEPRELQDLLESIEACCVTDDERTLCKRLVEGSTYQEIAGELNVPLVSIHRMRKEVYARFLKLTGWKGQK